MRGVNFLIGDLHIHSNNSDGSLDLEEIFYIASKRGIDYVSVTDHNFLNEKEILLKIGNKYGVGVVFGVEFSCFDFVRRRKVHVLCYNYCDDEILKPVCEHLTKIRIEVGNEKASFVMNNFPISKKLINKHKSKSGCIYQQNLVHALMESGYCNSIYGELYDGLSSKKLNIKVDDDFDVRYVLNLIRRAGGKAIVAHPDVYNSLDLIDELISEDLIDGIEIFHPRNSEETRKNLLKKVEEHCLIATGGTDFHGMYSSCYFSRIGSFFIPEFYLKKLLS